VPARVIVLAGPSGAGKTRLSRRLGLPVLNLDDFYKDGDDPTLPRMELAGGAPIVDWDSSDSWSATDAVEAICDLCTMGRAEVPVYEIARNGRAGEHVLDLQGSSYFVAEGIFAQEVVGACRDRGVLADAVCVTQPPLVTFLRRLWRDLHERRKPPLVLLRRGLHLVRTHRVVVERAAALGCRVRHPDQAYDELCRLTG
jgi:uridine kinase